MLDPASEGLDSDQFSRWSALIEARSGMRITQERKSFLNNRLQSRMDALEITSFDDYFNFIQAGGRGLIEWTSLIDLLTVHETFFLRNPNALGLLSEVLLPSFHKVAGNAAEYRAWSIGCSTGEEPYSLAMMIDQSYRKHEVTGYYSVTATDISLAALNTAKRGLYKDYAVEKVKPELRQEYFVGPSSGYYRVKDALRKRVCFTALNVLELAGWPLPQQHLIYCQNMLIYFERAQRHTILSQLVEFLLPGGVLIIGAGEGADWSHDQVKTLKYQGVAAFQRCVDSSKGSAGE